MEPIGRTRARAGAGEGREGRGIRGVEVAEPDAGEIAAARRKLEALEGAIRRMGDLLVAFSGGVDSTFLLKVAAGVLGDKARAITATSPTYPATELTEARSLARSMGVAHIVVESNELEIPNFSDNTEKRCYYCKTELFGIALTEARSMGFSFVADGSNADDLADFRPGGAAARELGVRSPLQEAGLGKMEIRWLSRELGLGTWNKPQLACLSSRFPYGTEITEERLSRVARGEALLRGLGFNQFRVRYHGASVRIEVAPGEITFFSDETLRAAVVSGFKEIGFTYVTVDLEGYRTGSMNEVLDIER